MAACSARLTDAEIGDAAAVCCRLVVHVVDAYMHMCANLHRHDETQVRGAGMERPRRVGPWRTRVGRGKARGPYLSWEIRPGATGWGIGLYRGAMRTCHFEDLLWWMRLDPKRR